MASRSIPRAARLGRRITGERWLEVMGPPQVRRRSFGGDTLQCSSVGCARGGWARIGWAASAPVHETRPPRPRRRHRCSRGSRCARSRARPPGTSGSPWSRRARPCWRASARRRALAWARAGSPWAASTRRSRPSAITAASSRAAHQPCLWPDRGGRARLPGPGPRLRRRVHRAGRSQRPLRRDHGPRPDAGRPVFPGNVSFVEVFDPHRRCPQRELRDSRFVDPTRTTGLPAPRLFQPEGPEIDGVIPILTLDPGRAWRLRLHLPLGVGQLVGSVMGGASPRLKIAGVRASAEYTPLVSAAEVAPGEIAVLTAGFRRRGGGLPAERGGDLRPVPAPAPPTPTFTRPTRTRSPSARRARSRFAHALGRARAAVGARPCAPLRDSPAGRLRCSRPGRRSRSRAISACRPTARATAPWSPPCPRRTSGRRALRRSGSPRSA